MSGPRPRPGILEIKPYVGGKATLAGGQPVVKLSSNESAVGASAKAIAAYREEASRLHRYPDGACTALRGKIAQRYNLDAERIVCGAGSDELIGLLARAYAGPGDEVLHSAHGFLMYRLAALAAGAHPVAAPETPELRADVDGLLARVTSRTRILFLANPNNPTGSYLTGAELARLHAGLPEEVLLVIDAAYAEFVDAPDYSAGQELALACANVVMCRTFSKLHGLAALRLGWMAGAAEIVDMINRSRGPFNVSQPAQAAGIAALDDLDHQDRAREHNRRWLPWLHDAISALGLKVWPSVGNFLLVEFPREAGRDAASARAALEEAALLVREMDAYGLGHCLRITVGLEDENRRLIAALADFVRRGGG